MHSGLSDTRTGRRVGHGHTSTYDARPTLLVRVRLLELDELLVSLCRRRLRRSSLRGRVVVFVAVFVVVGLS